MASFYSDSIVNGIEVGLSRNVVPMGLRDMIFCERSYWLSMPREMFSVLVFLLE